MARKTIVVTNPDGTKKIIVGKPSNGKPIRSNNIPVKTREIKVEDRRPKPGTPKISISNEKHGYKYGGQIKYKTR